MRKRTLTDVLLGLSIFLLVLTFLAGPAHAQFGSGTESKVIASAKFQLKSGSKTEGVIQVTATVVSKYHIYSVTQKKGGPLPTRISVVKPEEGVILGAWTPDKKPEIHHYDVYPGLDVEEHKGKIVWTTDVLFENALEDPADAGLVVKLSSLACTDDLGICVPQRTELEVKYAGEIKSPDDEEKPAEEKSAIESETEKPVGDEPVKSPFDLGGGFELPKPGIPSLGGGFESPGFASNNKSMTGKATYYFDPETGRGIVRVTVTVESGFHIYSLTQARGGPLPTRLKVSGEGVQVSGEVIADKEPEIHHYDVYPGLDVEEIKGTINWDIPILAPVGNSSELEIKVIVDALACTDDLGQCVPQKVNVLATLDESLSNPVANLPAPESVPDSAPESVGDESSEVSPVEIDEERSLIAVLGFALLGGFILNFMPCVLPVIGLKVMSFVNQAGESRSRVFALNLWYSLGLMSVFLVFATLAIALGLGWGQQNQYDSFNIVMISVIFVMGLSFIGVWEIPIPGFVGSSEMAKSAEKEGPVAAYIKGIITTLLAIPCSGPGLGIALTYCAKQMAENSGTQGAINVYLVFIALGIGMAFPYLVIGAKPSLVRFLPKPGGWMETFKELMGYVLLATIVFIMTYVAYPLLVPTIGFLFALWAACWWYGRVPFTATKGSKLKNRLGAVVFASLLGWFCFGWLATEMDYRFESLIEKRSLEAAVKSGGGDFVPKEGEKNLYTAGRLEQLLNEDKRLVMVDFTADWCLTCKTLEKAVLNTDAVQAALKEKEVVQLVADWTEMDSKTGLEIDAELERLGKGKQLPIIAFYSPGQESQPKTLVAVYTASDIHQILGQLDK
ncbi:MAG: hypothetical protein CMM06_14300 [Rhodopirellula sp.]|nr:hypothetical protein [Rhodopirellula sp.]|tara:strand:+ start:1804 stop:4338 length:2535 start_codon:yes stop_codon:yes gene_type:complete